MKCAIVCGSDEFYETKKKIFKKHICQTELVYADMPITIYSIPANALLKEKRLIRKIKKCTKELKRLNIECVYISDSISGHFKKEMLEDYFYIPNGEKIADIFLPDALKYCLKNLNDEIINAEIGIYQKKLDKRGYKILESICQVFRYITVYTDSAENARSFVSDLYEQNGTAVKVSDKPSNMVSCDSVILLDSPDRQIINENSYIIDLNGQYKYRCKNTFMFSMPFGFNKVMRYFSFPNQRCVEFLALACLNEITPKNLEQIGFRFKDISYCLLC